MGAKLSFEFIFSMLWNRICTETAPNMKKEE